MTSLRDAAQQALEALTNFFNAYPHMAKGYTEDAITALRAALAEPVEPVAWRITDGEGDWEYRTELPEDWSIQWSARYGRKYEPLYTAPPQRKPLTEEEIDRITDQEWAANNHKPIYAAHRAYARAIERARGIGEKE